MPERRRALVAGEAGFLGSHLCERLLSKGYRIVCMDNLRIGSLENIAHCGTLWTSTTWTIMFHKPNSLSR